MSVRELFQNTASFLVFSDPTTNLPQHLARLHSCCNWCSYRMYVKARHYSIPSCLLVHDPTIEALKITRLRWDNWRTDDSQYSIHMDNLVAELGLVNPDSDQIFELRGRIIPQIVVFEPRLSLNILGWFTSIFYVLFMISKEKSGLVKSDQSQIEAFSSSPIPDPRSWSESR